MWRTVPFLNACIAVVMFVVALVVICYMLAMFVIGVFDIGSQVMSAAFLPSDERQSLFALLNASFAYNVAYLFVLMKAYSVIAHYLRYYEVDVKLVVELGIIVAILELIFNAQAYPEHTQSVLMWLATASFAVYALRYHLRSILERLTTVSAISHSDTELSTDLDNNMEIRPEEVPVPVDDQPQPAVRRRTTIPKKREPVKRTRRLATK